MTAAAGRGLGLDEAVLLLYGAADFGGADWPEELSRRADAGNRRVFAALARLAEALGAQNEQGQDRIVLALVDLPLTVVRRHLRTGTPLPPHAEDLTEQCTTALLA